MTKELLQQAELALSAMLYYQSTRISPTPHEYGHARRTKDAISAALAQPGATHITWNAEGVRTINGVPDCVAQPVPPTLKYYQPATEEAVELVKALGYVYDNKDGGLLKWAQPIPPASAPLPVADDAVMVHIRRLFNVAGTQVCDTESETCHFYVSGPNPSCNHCQRGILDNRPHRLCPVLASTPGKQEGV